MKQAWSQQVNRNQSTNEQTNENIRPKKENPHLESTPNQIRYPTSGSQNIQLDPGTWNVQKYFPHIQKTLNSHYFDTENPTHHTSPFSVKNQLNQPTRDWH